MKIKRKYLPVPDLFPQLEAAGSNGLNYRDLQKVFPHCHPRALDTGLYDLLRTHKGRVRTEWVPLKNNVAILNELRYFYVPEKKV